MSSELRDFVNPRKWRFTWETQSHIPILRLFLFNPDTKPSTECMDLKVNLVLEQSLLIVSWFEVSLRVPIPRVLIDIESPVNFRALEDHIEVKLVLLLPVDDPIVSNFDSVLNLSEQDQSCPRNASSDRLQPLLMDSGSDLKNLSSGDGVHFCCRSCSAKLTRPLRYFEEMPSVNWREVADNWFGGCCCSFGGISEKLVTRYAKSYTCPTGVCLLTTTAVVICKDDLVGCRFPDWDGSQKYESELDFSGDNCLSKSILDSGNKHGRTVSFDNQVKLHDFHGNLSCICPGEDNLAAELELKVIEDVTNGDGLSGMLRTLEVTENVALAAPGCCVDTKDHILNHDIECCTKSATELSPKEQKTRTIEILENQRSLLNGFLGNVFMARSSNLSKDVQWIEFLCPQCSCLLGAYPRGNGDAPLDGGVRLFKCYISTCLGVGGSPDLFRKYTLERMFTNQLLESANDELSFRTVVRDLQTKCPMLQIILLNPNSWCCTGYCLGTMEPVAKIDMYPTIKVLYSDCSSSSEFELRIIEEWVTKNQADEVYMLASQIKELTESLELANNTLPSSHTFLQGLSSSSMSR